MKRYLLLLGFVICALHVKGQWLDTLRNDLHGSKWPTASFDSRNSFISDRRAHIWGLKAGVEFNSKLQFGLGYNFHDRRLTKNISYINDAGNVEVTKGPLHLS